MQGSQATSYSIMQRVRLDGLSRRPSKTSINAMLKSTRLSVPVRPIFTQKGYVKAVKVRPQHQNTKLKEDEAAIGNKEIDEYEQWAQKVYDRIR